MPRITSATSSTCARTLQAVTTCACPCSATISRATASEKNSSHASPAILLDLPRRLDADRSAVELAQQRPVVRADVDDQIIRAQSAEPPRRLPREILEVVMQRPRVPRRVRVVRREHHFRVDYDR
jgi:hypothetical protein